MTRDGRSKIFGAHEPQTLAQVADVAARAEHAALMADGHLGYVMPIGGVAAYRNQVSVVGVGFDIACGNAAIRTDATIADLGGTDAVRRATPARLADEIQGFAGRLGCAGGNHRGASHPAAAHRSDGGGRRV